MLVQCVPQFAKYGGKFLIVLGGGKLLGEPPDFIFGSAKHGAALHQDDAAAQL